MAEHVTFLNDVAVDLRATTTGEAKRVLGPEAVMLALQVNGRTVRVAADPGATLVQVLRDQLGLTGTKIGCDRGACSACTVWLDGEVAVELHDARLRRAGPRESRRSRASPTARRCIRSSRRSSSTTRCSAASARPGMVMSCAALVERNPDCTLDDVKAAVSGHLCRCGTYPNIFKATLAAAAARRQRPAATERRP